MHKMHFHLIFGILYNIIFKAATTDWTKKEREKRERQNERQKEKISNSEFLVIHTWLVCDSITRNKALNIQMAVRHEKMLSIANC